MSDEIEFQHDPFLPSAREIRINELCEMIRESSGDEKAVLEREMLQLIEGEKFFSTQDGVKIILLNGPPRCGKDTATDFALAYLGNRAERYRFAAPLKNGVHSLFGFNGVSEEHFNDIKDQPNSAFAGMTPRQAYIWMSEEVVKPKFGHDFFASVAVTSISGMKKPVIVVSDCGFVEEAKALIAAFGKENVALVHMYRAGTSFTGDSRSYITGVDCRKFAINNEGTVDELYETVTQMIDRFVNAK